MKLKLKKDDLVEIISGNDRAKKSKGQAPRRGRILEVDVKNQTVVVEGVNLRKNYEKVRQTKEGQAGGIIEREAPIHISNVMLVDPVTNKPVRVGTREENGKRVRVTIGKNASGSVIN